MFSGQKGYSNANSYCYGGVADLYEVYWGFGDGECLLHSGKHNITWADGHMKTREPLSLMQGVQYNIATPQNSLVVEKSRYVWDLE
jgi:prepilin-type processing-associated H-X9-DG protein